MLNLCLVTRSPPPRPSPIILAYSSSPTPPYTLPSWSPGTNPNLTRSMNKTPARMLRKDVNHEQEKNMLRKKPEKIIKRIKSAQSSARQRKGPVLRLLLEPVDPAVPGFFSYVSRQMLPPRWRWVSWLGIHLWSMHTACWSLSAKLIEVATKWNIARYDRSLERIRVQQTNCRSPVEWWPWNVWPLCPTHAHLQSRSLRKRSLLILCQNHSHVWSFSFPGSQLTRSFLRMAPERSTPVDSLFIFPPSLGLFITLSLSTIMLCLSLCLSQRQSELEEAGDCASPLQLYLQLLNIAWNKRVLCKYMWPILRPSSSSPGNLFQDKVPQ